MPPHDCYLISYDIHDSRRRQHVHRLLQMQAHPLLESLFVFQGRPDALQALREALVSLLHPRFDSLLIDCLHRNRPIHRWGRACLPPGLYDFSLPPVIEHGDERPAGATSCSNFTQLFE